MVWPSRRPRAVDGVISMTSINKSVNLTVAVSTQLHSMLGVRREIHRDKFLPRLLALSRGHRSTTTLICPHKNKETCFADAHDMIPKNITSHWLFTENIKQACLQYTHAHTYTHHTSTPATAHTHTHTYAHWHHVQMTYMHLIDSNCHQIKTYIYKIYEHNQLSLILYLFQTQI